MKLSVQLYTLREQVSADFPAVIAQVAQIGLGAVELAGYGSLKTAAEVRKALDGAGLVVSGAHVGIDALTGPEADRVFEEQQTLGNRFVIVPWIGEAYRSADGYRKLARELSQAAEAAAKRGLLLAYHNHNFEFQSYNGTRGLDIVWQHTDAKLVKAQLDVYWVAHAGVDPVAYIGELGANRVALLHLKDMTAEPEKKFAPVGSGVLDFKAIVAAARRAEVQWGAIEQDDCYGRPPIDSVRDSFNYLKSIGA